MARTRVLADLTPLRESRDYRFLFSGQVASYIGRQFTVVAIPIQVYAMTHSSLMVGLVGLASLGPLIVFFVANAKFNLFVATGAFMVAIVAAMIASYVVVRHVPMMAIVTAVIVLVFGTLTLVLHDETFIKVKPTIIYGLFAAILGGGLLFGRSFIAILFNQMLNLTPKGWRILTMRWALFFLAMAFLNEIIWRT